MSSPSSALNERPTGTGDTAGTIDAPDRGTTIRESAIEDSHLPTNVIFDLLSNERRREVLAYLRANDGAATLGELAEHVAKVELGIGDHEMTSKQRKRVYVALYQAHLPKLDDADVVDFNHARGTIELRDEAEVLFTMLADENAETTGVSRWITVTWPNLLEIVSDRLQGVLSR